jgi:hypothetical protein
LGSATGTGPFQQQNIEQVATSGDSLVIMVANGHAVRPFTGSIPLSLRVEVPSSAQWNFSWVRVDLKLWGAWRKVTNGTTETTDVYGNSFVLSSSLPAVPLASKPLVWTGNSFAADSGEVTWQPTPGTQATGQMTVSGSVDSQHSRLVTITFKDRYYNVQTSDPTCTNFEGGTVQEVTITNVPLSSSPFCPYGTLCFSLTGAAAVANTQFSRTETSKVRCTGYSMDSQTTWVPGTGTVSPDAHAAVAFSNSPLN